MKKTINIFLIFVFCFAANMPVFAWMPGKPHDKYALQQVIVFSRHSIRAPLSGSGSVLPYVTNHEWFNWTSAPAELSTKGAQLETIMGQFFQKWLLSENFISSNHIPKKGEMLFYANSRQRTITSAHYFASGMLPMANIKIKHRYAPEKMDPVFNPILTFTGNAYYTLVAEQFREAGGDKILKGEDENLNKGFRAIDKALDFEQSEMARKNGSGSFTSKDFKFKLEKNKQPAIKGMLKTAVQAGDALLLQYYEENDPIKAAFGHTMSFDEWVSVGNITSYYGSLMFRLPAVSVNAANPLLKFINKELGNKKRKFTFLCGHESNMDSLMAALRIKPYLLPEIETLIPVGAKLMFSRWLGNDGKNYLTIDLIYQSVEQLRQREMLSLENPPMIHHIELQDIAQNEDGFYALEDVRQRFSEAIESYKLLKKTAN